MRKPGGILLACLFLASVKATAQKVIVEQALGLAGSQANITEQAYATKDNGTAISSNFSVRLRQYGLVYQWRANLFQTKNLSLSLGTPLMLGWSVSRNYRSYDSDGVKTDTIQGIQGTQVSLEAPVALDLNFGLHSAKDESRRRLGAYVGIGYGYSFTRIKTSIGTVFYDGFEPLVRAGLRMGKAWETRWSINVSVKGGFSEGSDRMYGVQILKEL